MSCIVFSFKVYGYMLMGFVYQALFVGASRTLIHPRFSGLSERETGQLSGGLFTSCVCLSMDSERMCALHNDISVKVWFRIIIYGSGHSGMTPKYL